MNYVCSNKNLGFQNRTLGRPWWQPVGRNKGCLLLTDFYVGVWHATCRGPAFAVSQLYGNNQGFSANAGCFCQGISGVFCQSTSHCGRGPGPGGSGVGEVLAWWRRATEDSHPGPLLGSRSGGRGSFGISRTKNGFIHLRMVLIN